MVAKAIVCHSVGFNLGVEIFFKKRESEKGTIEIEDWSNVLHFVLGFQENSMHSLFAFLIIFW